MSIKVGELEALFLYPEKSVSGRLVDVATWAGTALTAIDAWRLAFRRTDDHSGFPWLTASKLREPILFAPERRGPADSGDLPNARSHGRRARTGHGSLFEINILTMGTSTKRASP